MFRRHDRVEVMPEDGSYYAELIVLSCDKLWAKMAVVQYVQLAEAETATDDGYEVKWRGAKKHSVIRTLIRRCDDRKPLHEGRGRCVGG